MGRGGGGADSGSCWWGLMERLALRALSSRADSLSGSICFISTEAGRKRREKQQRKRKKKQRKKKERQKVI